MGLLQIRQAPVGGTTALESGPHTLDEDHDDDEVIFISHLTETHIPVTMTTMMMTYFGQHQAGTTLSTRVQFVGL